MDGSIATSIESPSPSISTQRSLFRGTPTPLPSRRSENRRIDGVSWLRIGRQANIKRGSQVSRIWDHGDEYIDLSRPETSSAWICDLCDAVVAYRKTLSTSNVLRHLKNAHQIPLKRTQFDREEEDKSESELSRQSSVREIPPPSGFRALVTKCDVDRFRSLLLRWIIQRQIPYSAVEHTEFRDLLLYLQPSLEGYLIRSHQTITAWIGDEYRKARLAIKSQLVNA